MRALISLLLSMASLDAPAASRHPGPHVVTVTAVDFHYRAPLTVKPGVTTFRLLNAGTQVHHLQVVRLNEGKHLPDLVAALKNPGPPPAWMVQVGGPNAMVPHGTPVEATVGLEPGTYVLLCFVPSPGEQIPHAMKGMMKELTVSAGTTTMAEPKGDVDVRLTDYAFTFSTPLTRGKHMVRVTNDAAQPHELTLFKLAPGKTAADVGHWAESGMKGPPPGMPIGGVTGLSTGRSSTFTVKLAAGHYGLVCFLPDAKDGKPHLAHGMTQDVTVE